MHWMYYAYTGTAGKTGQEFTLNDCIHYEVKDDLIFTDSETGMRVDLEDLPEAEKEKIRIVMEQLVERHK